MENTAPSRALVRRAYQLLQLSFIIVAVSVFLIIVALLAFIIPPFPPSHPTFGLFDTARTLLFFLGIGVALAGVGLALRAVTRRRENDLALMTGNYLAQYLDNQYVFIRNINRPGLGYIDAVLIGPPGALVFRILNNAGVFANERSSWLVQNRRGDWAPFGINPTNQTIEDVGHLRIYLAKHGLGDIQVYGVIVFIPDESRVVIHQKEPVVPISRLDSLFDTLRGNYLARQDRTPPQAVAALRRLLLDE